MIPETPAGGEAWRAPVDPPVPAASVVALAKMGWGFLTGLTERNEGNLRMQLLALQVQKELGRKITTRLVEWAQWAQWLAQLRTDAIIIGNRDSGKTALAASWAQATQRPTYCLGWPEEACSALGFNALGRIRDLVPGSTLIVDEGALHMSTKTRDQELARTMALARHHDVRLIWTAQNATLLNRDVLRNEAVWCFKKLDPLAVQFERDELLEWLSTVVSLQDPFDDDKGRTVLYRNGGWLETSNPLPEGWSDDVSTLWREPVP